MAAMENMPPDTWSVYFLELFNWPVQKAGWVPASPEEKAIARDFPKKHRPTALDLITWSDRDSPYLSFGVVDGNLRSLLGQLANRTLRNEHELMGEENTQDIDRAINAISKVLASVDLPFDKAEILREENLRWHRRDEYSLGPLGSIAEAHFHLCEARRAIDQNRQFWEAITNREHLERKESSNRWKVDSRAPICLLATYIVAVYIPEINLKKANVEIRKKASAISVFWPDEKTKDAAISERAKTMVKEQKRIFQWIDDVVRRGANPQWGDIDVTHDKVAFAGLNLYNALKDFGYLTVHDRVNQALTRQDDQ